MTITLNTKAREIYVNQVDSNLLRVTEVKYFTPACQQSLTNVLLHQYYNTDKSIYTSTKEAPLNITDLQRNNVSIGTFTYKSVDVEPLQCEDHVIHQLRVVRELQFDDVDQCTQVKHQLENFELEVNAIIYMTPKHNSITYMGGKGLYLTPMTDEYKQSTIGDWI